MHGNDFFLVPSQLKQQLYSFNIHLLRFYLSPEHRINILDTPSEPLASLSRSLKNPVQYICSLIAKIYNPTYRLFICLRHCIKSDPLHIRLLRVVKEFGIMGLQVAIIKAYYK